MQVATLRARLKCYRLSRECQCHTTREWRVNGKGMDRWKPKELYPKSCKRNDEREIGKRDNERLERYRGKIGQRRVKEGVVAKSRWRSQIGAWQWTKRRSIDFSYANSFGSASTGKSGRKKAHKFIFSWELSPSFRGKDNYRVGNT